VADFVINKLDTMRTFPNHSGAFALLFSLEFEFVNILS
jgi:hypothetical protein